MLNDLANRALTAAVHVMGEPVTMIRGQESWQIKGIFQDAYRSVDPETGMAVTTQQPVLGVNFSTLPTRPKNGDTIQARGLNYRIRDIQVDGHTGMTIFLHRTTARN